MKTRNAQAKSSTVSLLEQVYQITAAEADTVRALLPKVESEDATFKSELTLWLGGCESLATRANALLSKAGELTLEGSLTSRMTAKVATSMNTLMDSSVGHIAALLLQYANATMTDAVRILREFENTTASEAALTLARDLIQHEEAYAERMKGYL
ncbi:MAG: hypothetical protein J6R04_01130 [Clostridia bacterium]|nr:hypothetical protein [Clostridia bacterium]